MLQLLVGAGKEVIAALELRGTDEDAAVGGRRGPELEPEEEVAGELLRGPELLDAAPLRRRGDDDPAILGDVAAVGAALAAVEVELLLERRLVAVAPAGEVVAVEALAQGSLKTRIRRYSSWPESPSRPIGPVSGSL